MNMHANTVGIIEQPVLKDIYIIKNRINDKVYIGQSINAGERFVSHCKPSSADESLISKAIQKYGANNFWYEILEHQIPNYNEREQYWIAYYNSMKPNGYNLMPGGEEPPHKYGVEHPLSTFENMQIVKQIKDDLRNTNISLSKIALKYDTSKHTILRINQGLHYEEPGETYPIRKNPNMNGKLTEEQVEEIIELLKYSYRCYDDIGEQYGVQGSTIKHINEGNIHKKTDIDYPIRKYKNSGTPNCTYEQVTKIINMLLNTDISCRQISKIIKQPLNTIYAINNGTAKRYRRDGYTYPLRKRNKVQ